ncbi:MAG: extracellular solute-binding protein [Armatimonadota bacterium]
MRHRTVVVCLAVSVLISSGCRRQTDAPSRAAEVTVYVALDRPYSEPVLRAFEKESGVRVNAVYDLEANKTTGLVNRLMAERENPQCDVFWNNEIARTLVLKSKGLLQPYVSASARDIPARFKDPSGYWCGFAARARVLVYNTRIVARDERPRSIVALLEPRWRGRIAIANPMFGTTGTHAAALFAAFGQGRAKEYFEQLKANGVKVLPGNAAVRDMVAQGECAIGLTDTDDVWAGIRGGKPIAMTYPDEDGQGTLVIPNTVALIKGAPHPGPAMSLIDYLLSRETEERLAACGSHQMPVRAEVPRPEGVPGIADVRSFDVSYEEIAAEMQRSQAFLQDLFMR